MHSTNGAVTLEYAVGATCFVTVNVPAINGAAPSQSWYTSDNGGATWTASQGLTYNKYPINITAVDPTNKYLLGNIGGGGATTLESTDRGQTWQALPALPNGMQSGDARVTPDGTIVTQGFFPTPTNSIVFLLAAGANTWTQISPLDANDNLVNVLYDVNGHASAIWANAGRDAMSGIPQRGLQAHAP